VRNARSQTGEQSVDTRASAVTVPDSKELDEMVGRTLRQATGKALSGRMVRNYLSLPRLPAQVRELSNAAGLCEFRLRPVIARGNPDQESKTVQRIVTCLDTQGGGTLQITTTGAYDM
jgi:hypothetical protein